MTINPQQMSLRSSILIAMKLSHVLLSFSLLKIIPSCVKAQAQVKKHQPKTSLRSTKFYKEVLILTFVLDGVNLDYCSSLYFLRVYLLACDTSPYEVMIYN